MKILLTNDDGYRSLGIKYLHNALSQYGEIVQAAPIKNMSACSSSLSVHTKVEIKNPSKDFYVIKGTPADCVHIVSKGVLKKLPDIPFNKIKGIKYTSLGNRKTSHKPNITTSNQKILASIGPVSTAVKSTKSNDFNAIKSKYISITPLTIDMCDHKKIINRIYKPK